MVSYGEIIPIPTRYDYAREMKGGGALGI
jgi:hypothetical protein